MLFLNVFVNIFENYILVYVLYFFFLIIVLYIVLNLCDSILNLMDILWYRFVYCYGYVCICMYINVMYICMGLEIVFKGRRWFVG